MTIIITKISHTMKKEIKFTLGTTEKGTEIIIVNLIIMILMVDLVAMFPQIFSLSSHLTFNIPLSISMWLLLIIFGLLNKTKHMVTHLLPQGTPIPLILFIVMIEITRNVIRPLTLCVRLTANIIAGHILLSLLGSIITKISTWIVIPRGTLRMILSTLELAVAFIQAYVFITLITLYVTELK